MLRSRLENRWNSLKYLDEKSKIDLITMLSMSLSQKRKKKSVSASKFYGIWGDDGMSDAEFAEFLKEQRTFNQEIVEKKKKKGIFLIRTYVRFIFVENTMLTRLLIM